MYDIGLVSAGRVFNARKRIESWTSSHIWVRLFSRGNSNRSFFFFFFFFTNRPDIANNYNGHGRSRKKKKNATATMSSDIVDTGRAMKHGGERRRNLGAQTMPRRCRMLTSRGRPPSFSEDRVPTGWRAWTAGLIGGERQIIILRRDARATVICNPACFERWRS